jgi:isoaspartyl peptidase/L-asparaginase-like protein (Ntn-hydrolase superfamily)
MKCCLCHINWRNNWNTSWTCWRYAYIEAGAYCDNNVGTGHDESLMKVTLTGKALWLVEKKKSSQEAALEALADMLTKVGGRGGIITVTPNGHTGIHFTTERMAWALRSELQRKCGIEPKDLSA